jgi:hypothetical protein
MISGLDAGNRMRGELVDQIRNNCLRKYRHEGTPEHACV